MGVLSAVEADVVNLVLETLTQCGRAPDGATRYHCTPPSDCATDAGTLTITWQHIYPAGNAPRPSGASWTCTDRPAADLRVRLLRCWPIAKSTFGDTDFDTPAAHLADDALTVSLVLQRETCAPNGLLAPHGVAFVDAVPLCPAQGAGVEWRLTVRLRPTSEDFCIALPIGS